MATSATRGPRLPDGARAASPPGTAPESAPTVLLVGNAGKRLEAVGEALVGRGTRVRVATFAEADRQLEILQPDLLVVFGPGAEVFRLERLIRGAKNVPSAVLAATPEQRHALRAMPSGSVLVVPASDSQEAAIQRLGQLAADLARHGAGVKSPDFASWAPNASSAFPAGGRTAPPAAQERPRLPPSPDTSSWSEGSEAPTLPRPSRLPTLPRIVGSAPPPPARAASTPPARSMPPPVPQRSHPPAPIAASNAPPPPERTYTPAPGAPSNAPPPPRRAYTPAPGAPSNAPPPPRRAYTPAPGAPSNAPPPPERSQFPAAPARTGEALSPAREPAIPRFGDVPNAPAFAASPAGPAGTPVPVPLQPFPVAPSFAPSLAYSHPAPTRRRRRTGLWVLGLFVLVLVSGGAGWWAWSGWPADASAVSRWVPPEVRALWGESRPTAAAPSAASVAPSPVAPPATSHAAAPSAAFPAPAPSASQGAAPVPSASQDVAPTPPPSSADGIVEKQVDTPRCDKLLEGVPAEPGPPGALAQIKRAAEFLRVKKLDDAQRVYCRAVFDHPRHPGARLALLELLTRRRDNRAVILYGRQAMEAFPKDVQFSWLVGDALARSGDWKGARAVWLAAPGGAAADEEQRARQLARQNLNAARAAARPGHYALAERAFRRVAILDPSDIEASTGVAQMLMLGDDPPSAAAWARQALRRAPRYATLHVVLGNALDAAGEAEGARAAWQEALKLDGGNREALYRLQKASQR